MIVLHVKTTLANHENLKQITRNNTITQMVTKIHTKNANQHHHAHTTGKANQ